MEQNERKELLLEAINDLKDKYKLYIEAEIGDTKCTLCEIYGGDFDDKQCWGCPNKIFHRTETDNLVWPCMYHKSMTGWSAVRLPIVVAKARLDYWTKLYPIIEKINAKAFDPDTKYVFSEFKAIDEEMFKKYQNEFEELYS